MKLKGIHLISEKNTFVASLFLLFSFKINHTPADRQFRVDLNISLWFDNSNEMYKWQIFKQNVLTYSQCDFNTDFETSGK